MLRVSLRPATKEDVAGLKEDIAGLDNRLTIVENKLDQALYKEFERVDKLEGQMRVVYDKLGLNR